MQARYYDPVIGRFLSNDPVGFAEGGVGYFNRYAYTFNNPISYTDPTGMCGQDADGNPIGVCATNAGAAPLVNDALNDPNSELSTLDAEAQAAGIFVDVSTGTTDLRGQNVRGGVTETIPAGTIDNDKIVIAITIDTTDIVQTIGTDTTTGQTVVGILTPAEILEHEGAGHALDKVRGIDRGEVANESNARDVGNRFRQKSGSTFHRTSPDVWIK